MLVNFVLFSPISATSVLKVMLQNNDFLSSTEQKIAAIALMVGAHDNHYRNPDLKFNPFCPLLYALIVKYINFLFDAPK